MRTSKIESEGLASSAELGRLKQEVASLANSFEKLREQLADQSRLLADVVGRLGGAVAQGAPQTHVSAATDAATAAESVVSPELLVVMAAAVTSFLGKKVRIRSAKMLQSPYEIINPWAQQGRVTVQASHHPRTT